MRIVRFVKRPRAAQLWLLALAVFACFCAGYWHFNHPRAPDPVYRGKKLSEWLVAYSDRMNSHAPYDSIWEQRKEAQDAILHIGTNGLPLMIEMLKSTDTELEQRIGRAIPSRMAFRLGLGDANDRRAAAAFGFSALQEVAAPATPQLRMLLTNANADTRSIAINTLYSIRLTDEQLIPDMIPCLNDPDKGVRDAALWVLARLTSR